MSQLGTEDIDAVCGLVSDLCGIYLDESKDYLIENRLADLLKRHGCESYVALAQKARAGDRAVKTDIVNAITTNETLWFRDTSPFEALKNKVFPELIDARGKSICARKLRVWSAACSTGQEAYSIAMTLLEIMPDLEGWDVKIVGTDICETAVAHATTGHYSKMEIGRGLDQSHLSGYFVQEGDGWTVCDAVKNLCRFEVGNLFSPFTHFGKFDIIFCRNVVIYFTPEDRKKIFHRVSDSLASDGWLFAGASELLSDLGPNWKAQQHCRAMCYRPNMESPAMV